MSAFKHTPGPWVVDAATDRNVVGVADEAGNPICEIYHGLDGWTIPSKCTTKEWKLERARLIASAPELLEAAEAAWTCIAELAPTQARVEVAQMLLAAIAKATGGAA